jgi:hypothetical protein
MRCGTLEVRTDWWFGFTYSGESSSYEFASYASWWREPGDGLDASTGWRSVTAYSVEVENNGYLDGAGGAPTSGNAGVRLWADRVGLGSLTKPEAMCALTVLAGMRPTPKSNGAFAW